jgi:nitroimidazol reductase NimA-like FMN-containing flavoprotein (pyridoxamine 5'-phosphate oxidase superfamily)
MLIEEMSRTDCLRILAGTRLGRLACVRENQPYVVPIYFVYEDLSLPKTSSVQY